MRKGKESKLSRAAEPRVGLYFLVMLIFAGVTFWFQFYAGVAEAVLVLLLYLFYQVTRRRRRREIERYISDATGDLDAATSDTMLNAPFPMMIFRVNTEEILWSNDLFLRMTDAQEHLFDVKLKDVLPSFDTRWLMEGKTEYPREVVIGERRYSVYGHIAKAGSHQSGYIATTYWLDITEASALKEEYYASRPVVSILTVDNYDELCRNVTDNGRSALRIAIDQEIEQWTAPTGGMMCRYDRDKYLFVFQERHLTGMQDAKFSLLDSVHKVTSPNGISASVSIGIGMDEDFGKMFEYASLATEMALSRGGDQAVIKNRFNFEFYGGRAKETERNTRVKSRVMANALGGLVGSATTVYAMGHKFSDLDALGACVGVVAIARKYGVKARIVAESQQNPASQLMARLKELPEYKGVFVTADNALLEADNHSLLVVVDTNRPDQVISEQLLLSCNKVAVIDHHRRAADYISNAALNYHELYASSACELVTELMQYLLESADLLKAEAEALLSGIMLDTKCFAIRTGGRTFETAAFLRRCGADPTAVKRMFQSNLSDTIAKFDIIRNAQIYKNGVAIAPVDHAVGRVTAAQAADELLNVEGVTASFVLFPDEEQVIISGRSIGPTNVQVILETLGGGGNAAASGAQIKNTDLEQAVSRLVHAIDQYFETE